MATGRICRVERRQDIYVAHTDDGALWTRVLDFHVSHVPFREELIWEEASVVAIGGGDCVHFLSEEAGASVKVLQLGDDFFGHFGPDAGETLGDFIYVLGWRHVFAIDTSLSVRWTSKDVAVDGITWQGQDGERIVLSAEMDPPGGWERVVLDARCGLVLARGSE